MRSRKDIEILLDEALELIESIVSEPKIVLRNYSGVLFGKDGILDSLETITLLIQVDQGLEATYGEAFDVTSLILAKKVPFYTKIELFDEISKHLP